MSCFSISHLSAVNHRDWQAHMSPEERAMEGKNKLMYRRKSGGRGRERETALSPAERKYDKYDNWNDEILLLGSGFRYVPKGISPSITVIFSLSVPLYAQIYKHLAPTHTMQTNTKHILLTEWSNSTRWVVVRVKQEAINLKVAVYKPTGKVKKKYIYMKKTNKQKKNSVGSSGRTLSCEDRRCMAQGR